MTYNEYRVIFNDKTAKIIIAINVETALSKCLSEFGKKPDYINKLREGVVIAGSNTTTVKIETVCEVSKGTIYPDNLEGPIGMYYNFYAVPREGYKFKEWILGSAVISTNPEIRIALPSTNSILIANFVPIS